MESSRSSVNYKKGDVHPETGLLFWQYHPTCKNKENWISKELYEKKTISRNKSSKKYKKNNPDKQHNCWLKWNYGITKSQYDEMLVFQNGKCAICETDSCSTGRKLAVDHDHKAGKIRGLLCQSCNTSLGKMKDSPYLLRKAADYLEK